MTPLLCTLLGISLGVALMWAWAAGYDHGYELGRRDEAFELERLHETYSHELADLEPDDTPQEYGS